MLLKGLLDDFPVLQRTINGKNLIYLDSAASSLKPSKVVDKVAEFYSYHYANVHRAVHTLASESTEMMENSRSNIAKLLNAESEEIVFTSGTTMSINFIVESFVRTGILKKNDAVLVTAVEHHANFVPWLRMSKLHGFSFKAVKPSGRFGELLIDDFAQFTGENPKILAITGHSNVTGQVINIKKIRELFPDTILIVDGAQLLPHNKVDVKDLNIDFLVFSAHKMLGPSGIGVLYGKKKLLEKMEPFLYGGEMIDKVTLEDVTFNVLPYKFEAGTPHIAGIVGFGVAVDYLNSIGFENISEHVSELTQYAIDKISKLDFVEIYGPLNEEHHAILSFNIDGVHPHDVAHMLDQEFGIAVRSGHHCAQPLMSILKDESKLSLFPNATCRASFYIYNTKDDIDILVDGIKFVKRWFS
ncbi:SufS family cysteine desulfurase [Thermosipho ferrireducens]|uniref:Cysteine desulfurase n=1 Tax=Thermosipho ferrireducens TaxID=2571116 RepID=A0ABX7S8J9_9BACT|nr:SufS family cysteine desulfurase [Thermosipho ferrireducens]QTA38923.1 SufS family cysteine desulfurase [Thermosipho ferrireducens]